MLLRRRIGNGWAVASLLGGMLVIGSFTAPTGAGPPAPAASGPRWAPVPIQGPAGLSHDFLATGNIACTGKWRCVVAGYAEDEETYPAAYQALIWRFNGKSWKLQSTGQSGSAALVYTACPGTRECFSVGARLTGPKNEYPYGWIDHFNGKKWSRASIPHAAGVSLNGVACVSVKQCLVDGNQQTSSDSAHAVGYRWNGRSWAMMPMPSPKGALWTVLDSLNCSTRTHCVAFGDADNSKSGSAYFFAESWNGRHWSLQAMPNPYKFDLGNETGLYSASCGTTCLAVGDAMSYTGGQSGASFPSGVAYERVGRKWKSLAPPHSGKPNSYGYVLNIDSCVGGSCWVPLEAEPPNNPYTGQLAVAQWRGGRFSQHSVPIKGYLDALSCALRGRATVCLGLGEGPHGSTGSKMIGGKVTFGG